MVPYQQQQHSVVLEQPEAVAESARRVKEANMAAQAAVVTFYTVIGDFLTGLTGFSFGFGTTEDAQKKANEENDARNKEQKQKEAELMSQNQPLINALGKQVAATGGDFNTFMAQLRAAIHISRSCRSKELQQAFDNIKKRSRQKQQHLKL